MNRFLRYKAVLILCGKECLAMGTDRDDFADSFFICPGFRSNSAKLARDWKGFIPKGSCSCGTEGFLRFLSRSSWLSILFLFDNQMPVLPPPKILTFVFFGCLNHRRCVRCNGDNGSYLSVFLYCCQIISVYARIRGR